MSVVQMFLACDLWMEGLPYNSFVSNLICKDFVKCELLV